jgi:hypothetical protein
MGIAIMEILGFEERESAVTTHTVVGIPGTYCRVDIGFIEGE